MKSFTDECFAVFIGDCQFLDIHRTIKINLDIFDLLGPLVLQTGNFKQPRRPRLKDSAFIHRKRLRNPASSGERHSSLSFHYDTYLLDPLNWIRVKASASSPPLPQDLPPDERYWQAQLRFHQQEYAIELYALSRQALGAGHVSFAVDLVREIVRYDSDHKQARKILGFVRSSDEWISAFEAEMAKKMAALKR